MITAMASAEVPKFSVILRKSYAAGYYAMCAPGFGPRASIARPTAALGPMAAEASVNAMYAPKIAAISDPGERTAFVDARLAEQRADINLLRLASELVVDSIVELTGLRAELIDRLADAAHWTRGPQRHIITSARSDLQAGLANGTSGEDAYDRQSEPAAGHAAAAAARAVAFGRPGRAAAHRPGAA
jgi:acetyl-CoA carboxylase carboxyltransferase component